MPIRLLNLNTAPPQIFQQIKLSRSAHDAFKIAQHPYVLKKLLESANREIIEDSWCDAEWGWGENKNAQNPLGRIWMELRKEYAKKS